MSDAGELSGERVPTAGSVRWLTPGVGAVGAASFFSDAGHEVTTSVLPAFLTSTLGASVATATTMAILIYAATTWSPPWHH